MPAKKKDRSPQASDAAQKIGPSGSCRRHRPVIGLLALLCTASIITNMWGMAHYRLPTRLWQAIDRYRHPVPQIDFVGRYLPANLPARMAYPSDAVSPEAAMHWQSMARDKLRELLHFNFPAPASGRVVRREELGAVWRDTLVLSMPGGMETPAFMLGPKGATPPRPGVLVIPAHSRGIVSTAGIVKDFQHSNALALAEAGCVVLTVEQPGFGYLTQMGEGAETVDRSAHIGLCLIRGTTAIGLAVEQAAAALSYLAQRPETLGGRIGVAGMSSGGRAAVLLAGLDLRVDLVVASGCVHSIESGFRASLHDASDAVPDMSTWLDMDDCLSLIAPRPLLVQWGEHDRNRAERCAAFNDTSLAMFESARRCYAAYGEADNLVKVVSSGLGHEFDTPAAVAFVRQHWKLGGG